MVSSDVVSLLIESGLTPAAARQRVSRATGAVRRLRVALPNRTTFLYLEDQYRTEEFWTRLITTFDKTNSVYGVAFHSLAVRGGRVPREQFHIVSGSPKRLTGHIGSETVLKQLQRIGLIGFDDEMVRILPEEVSSVQTAVQVRARLSAERILLDGLAEWLRKLGLASFHKVRVRTDKDQPVFGQFEWDLCAPSYVQPLSRFRALGKPDPGFVVADVMLVDEVSKQQIAYFLNKCTVMRSLRNTKPFLALLVADGFERQAWNLGRQKGLLITTPGQLFGNDVARALRDLVGVLANAAASAVKKPDLIADLIEKLGKIEGAAINVRGALFELIVAHRCQRKGWRKHRGRTGGSTSGDFRIRRN